MANQTVYDSTLKACSMPLGVSSLSKVAHNLQNDVSAVDQDDSVAVGDDGIPGC